MANSQFRFSVSYPFNIYRNILFLLQQLHILFEHVPEVARKSNGVGLAVFNEAASESVYRDFKSKWNDYAVLDRENPQYEKRLLSAVSAYNSMHV